MGLVPKEIKSENMIFKSLSLFRIFGIIGAISVGSLLGKFIYPKLTVPFMIFCVVVFLILTSRLTNRNKTFLKGLVSFLKFSKGHKKYYGNNHIEYIKSKEHINEKKERKGK